MARISYVYPDKNGLVRQALLRIKSDDTFREVKRPISKIVLIMANEWFQSPPKEPDVQDLNLQS